MSANSVLLISNVLQVSLRKHGFSRKLLEKFHVKKGKIFELSFAIAPRNIHEIDQNSMYEKLSELPFANVAPQENQQSSIGFSNIAPDKDFQVFVSTCHQNRSLLVPDESLDETSGLLRFVYVVADSQVKLSSDTSFALNGGISLHQADQLTFLRTTFFLRFLTTPGKLWFTRKWRLKPTRPWS